MLPDYPSYNRGFSLIEVMVALVIFSMISIGAIGVLTELQRSQAALEERSAELETLQRVSLFAWHDLSEASPRLPPSAKAGTSSMQLTPPGTLTFTSIHWSNPMQDARSTLAIIRYGTEDDKLVQQVWPFTAPANSPPAVQQVLAGGVTNVSFSSITSTVSKSPFPAAVEIHLTLPPFGEIIQLVPLVQAP